MYSSRYPGKRFVKGILLRLRFCSCRLLQPQRSCSLRPEKSSLVPIIYHKNREIRPRKMIIWLLGCFFVESKGERVVDALKKNLLVFILAFKFFSSILYWKLRVVLGLKTPASFIFFLFLREQTEEQLGCFC